MIVYKNVYYRDNNYNVYYRFGDFEINKLKFIIIKYNNYYWIEIDMCLINGLEKLIAINYILDFFPVFNEFNMKKLITKNMIMKLIKNFINDDSCKFPSILFQLNKLDYSFNYDKITIVRSVEFEI